MKAHSMPAAASNSRVTTQIIQEPYAIVHPDKARMFQRHHPWVFAGAIESVRGRVTDGDLITLCTSDREFLARGFWNRHSQIRVRALTWEPQTVIDDQWWIDRIDRAIGARASILADGQTDACRLIASENDGLPGLTVDRYGDWLVLQAGAVGIETRKELIVKALIERLHPRGIFERSDDSEMRHKEGLPIAVGVLYGEPPPALIPITENGLHFLVDIVHGHKTGFYLDQRETRALYRRWLTAESDHGKRPLTVLNCFSYTGGFAAYGLSGGATRVINIDSSEEALDIARQTMALNGFKVEEDDFREEDVFRALRRFRDLGQQFDAIVLDPPKFAQTQAQVDGACRGYKDINWLAFRLLRPGGLLLTCSCSGAIDTDLFQKVVFGALVDAKREAQILARLGPGPDHPIALTFPEGAYLKGLLCRVW